MYPTSFMPSSRKQGNVGSSLATLGSAKCSSSLGLYCCGRTAGRVPRGCQWTLNALDKSLRLFQDRMQHTLRIQRNKVIFPRLDVWDSKDFVFSPRGKRVKQVFPFLWTPWEQLMLVLQRRYGLTSIVNREVRQRLQLSIALCSIFHTYPASLSFMTWLWALMNGGISIPLLQPAVLFCCRHRHRPPLTTPVKPLVCSCYTYSSARH